MSIDTTALYSGYGAAKVVNAVFAKKGWGKQLPPQMFYNYMKKGYIRTIDVEGRQMIEGAELQRWLDGYTTRRNVRVTQ